MTRYQPGQLGLPRHRDLPGLERGQHRDLLDGHLRPARPAGQGGPRRPRPGRPGCQARRPGDGDPARLPAEAASRQFYADQGRRQAGLEVRRRHLAQPLPARPYPRRPGTTRPGTPEDSMALLGRGAGAPGQGQGAVDRSRSGTPRSTTACTSGVERRQRRGRRSPTDLQVAYVMRTFLLNAAQGVQAGRLVRLRHGQPARAAAAARWATPCSPTRTTARPAPSRRPGCAFTRVQAWMAGTLVGTTTKRPCIADKNGTYTCLIQYATRRRPGLLEPVHDAPR